VNDYRAGQIEKLRVRASPPRGVSVCVPVAALCPSSRLGTSDAAGVAELGEDYRATTIEQCPADGLASSDMVFPSALPSARHFLGRPEIPLDVKFDCQCPEQGVEYRRARSFGSSSDFVEMTARQAGEIFNAFVAQLQKIFDGHNGGDQVVVTADRDCGEAVHFRPGKSPERISTIVGAAFKSWRKSDYLHCGALRGNAPQLN
jgi:hypothetical protein